MTARARLFSRTTTGAKPRRPRSRRRASSLSDDREAAIVATLDPGAYTAILQGKNNTTGTALVEAYDLDATAEAQFANISTRGLVGTDDAALIGGLIVSSEASAQANIVVRALGPSLGAIGVTGALQDPTLELHDSNGGLVALNDNWRDTQEGIITSTGLEPSDDREAAIFAHLAAGRLHRCGPRKATARPASDWSKLTTSRSASTGPRSVIRGARATHVLSRALI